MHSRALRTLGALVGMQAVALAATPAIAQDATSSEAPGAAAAVFSCKAITDAGERLACYDREVDALQKAEANDQVVIVSQDVVKKARRDLFGFSLPKLELFKKRGKQEEVEEVKEIEDTLASFAVDRGGRVMMTLSNGARWMQTDNTPVLGNPKPGDAIIIKSAALGSYMASIGGRRAIRVRRVN